MFIERLSTKFELDEPIFIWEILRLFPDYSRAQIFRFIKNAKQENNLIQFSQGVYYMPRITSLGTVSKITPDSVIYKKYVKTEHEVYGVFSGLKLLNKFGATTQMPAVTEIITNNESTRCREIDLNGRKFILHKSYCKITKDNYAAYTVLQFFTDTYNQDRFTTSVKREILCYIKEKKVSINQLYNLTQYFPAKTTKRLVGSGIINEIV